MSIDRGFFGCCIHTHICTHTLTESNPNPPIPPPNHSTRNTQEKNLATLMHFFLPCLLAAYVGIILQGYSIKEFNGLVTNRYFLLGAWAFGSGYWCGLACCVRVCITEYINIVLIYTRNLCE